MTLMAQQLRYSFEVHTNQPPVHAPKFYLKRGKKKLVRTVPVLPRGTKLIHAAYPLPSKSREVDFNTQRRLRL